MLCTVYPDTDTAVIVHRRGTLPTPGLASKGPAEGCPTSRTRARRKSSPDLEDGSRIRNSTSRDAFSRSIDKMAGTSNDEDVKSNKRSHADFTGDDGSGKCYLMASVAPADMSRLRKLLGR